MPQVEIGIQESYSAAGMELDNIVPNSPAAAAGLKAEDRIVGINGNGAASAPSWNRLVLLTWLASRPGDTLVLTVQRPGQPAPLVLRPVFRRHPRRRRHQDLQPHCGATDYRLLSNFVRRGWPGGPVPSLARSQRVAAGGRIRHLDRSGGYSQRVSGGTACSPRLSACLPGHSSQPALRAVLLLLRGLSPRVLPSIGERHG